MLTDNHRLDESDFAAILPTAVAAPRGEEPAPPQSLRPLPQFDAEIERNSIESALARTGGTRLRAASFSASREQRSMSDWLC
jgi:hypothetical protein